MGHGKGFWVMGKVFGSWERLLGHGVVHICVQATTNDLRRSYKELCRIFHPDKSKNNRGVNRLLEIQEAHEILIDPYLRHHYGTYDIYK